jgi:hypothetical protein
MTYKDYFGLKLTSFLSSSINERQKPRIKNYKTIKPELKTQTNYLLITNLFEPNKTHLT